MVILQNKYNQTQQFAISGPHNYAGFDFRSEFLYMQITTREDAFDSSCVLFDDNNL